MYILKSTYAKKSDAKRQPKIYLKKGLQNVSTFTISIESTYIMVNSSMIMNGFLRPKQVLEKRHLNI
jgi:hypothetical protein